MLLPLRQLVYNFKYSTIIWQGHHSLHHTNCGKIWDVSQSLLIEGLCAFDSVYKCLGNYFFKESGLLLFSCFPSWVIELNRDCTGDLQIQHYWLFIFSLMSQLWFFFLMMKYQRWEPAVMNAVDPECFAICLRDLTISCLF